MKAFFILLAGLILHNITSGQSILMTVDGSSQGKFKTETTGGQKDDKMIVTAIAMEAGTGSSASGAVTGRRQHQPFLIKKTAGVASPQFFQALVNSELLKRVVIELKGANANGEEVVLYTITLENARVTNYKQSAEIPDTGKAPKNLLMDEIKLVYQKITVESNTGYTTATDDAGATR